MWKYAEFHFIISYFWKLEQIFSITNDHLSVITFITIFVSVMMIVQARFRYNSTYYYSDVK